MSPPEPTRARWQPLRIGLNDLFLYDHEEFAFRDGRLLLRGNNGTGKSKVLALTLPFLLDGELSPHRVEPDADPNKRMEWNLLLGGEHPHPDRLGYTWLEFGRVDEHGPEYCTIGCGMKASAGRGMTGNCFFVTDQRIGQDLHLVDHTQTALGFDRLSDAIGERGTVHRRKRDYRRAVDERLFGLGEQRYGALVDLLVKIRQPQLSKRPDEKSLSRALTDALPPLDQPLLHNVAEAFRALEDDAAELEAMREAHEASARYLSTYCAYARMATRRSARPLRKVNSEFERVGRDLTASAEAHEAAVAALAAARDRLAALRADEASLTGRADALRTSPDADRARELQDAFAQARGVAREHDESVRSVGRLADQAAVRQQRTADAAAELQDDLVARDELRHNAFEHARGAALGASFSAAFETREPAQLPRAVRELIERQRTGVARVEQLVRAVDQAQRALVSARQTTELRASEHADASGRRDEAQNQVDSAGARYADSTRAHVRDARELVLPDPAAVFGALEVWLEALDGPNPLEHAISAAGHDAVRRLERAEGEERRRAEETRANLTELERESAELKAGVHPTPAPPATRAAAVRAGRAGAPLWQLTEFRDGVAEDQRAGLEAALEASGILDAWVTPSGDLLDPETEDTLLTGDVRLHDGPRLSEVLTPAGDCTHGVSADHVWLLLGAIGLGEGAGTVWVTEDGRFRNGAVTGAWHKPAAQFVGHTAREAARLARLRVLAAAIDEAREALAGIESALAALAARRDQLSHELAERPLDVAVRDAHARLGALEAEVAAAAERVAAARSAEELARAAVDEHRTELSADAADFGLPAGGDELAAVAAALGRLEPAVAALWPAIDRVTRAERALADARADAEESEQELGGARVRLTDIEHRLATAVERRDTLQATAGAAIAELERQQHEVTEALRANGESQRAAEETQNAAYGEEGAARTRKDDLTAQQERLTEDRVGTVDTLKRFVSTGLLLVALPDVPAPDEWNVTQALRLAREIEQALASEPDEDSRWARLQQRVSEDLGPLADGLRRHNNNAAMYLREEGIVIEVTFRGQQKTLPQLASELEAEVGYRQQLLDSREREILENHLVGEVASALQELIVAAEERVRDTNSELADRPTSTGMQLRLRWGTDPSAPDGLADARQRLLRQTTDAWSDEDRAAVGDFLQRQISAVRAEDTTSTWIERLTRAFDYRHWHRFIIERKQNNAWHPATGPSSGGERVLAASVPLFAAASSYYTSAGNPHAPRMVMLDEAFAGVDDRARAKCLGLLTAFDLDVVMTSEREWGCYAEVPGLAIAQLSRIDGIAAVLVTRWEWDGVARARVEDAPEPAPVSAVAPSDEPQLWDPSTPSD